MKVHLDYDDLQQAVIGLLSQRFAPKRLHNVRVGLFSEKRLHEDRFWAEVKLNLGPPGPPTTLSLKAFVERVVAALAHAELSATSPYDITATLERVIAQAQPRASEATIVVNLLQRLTRVIEDAAQQQSCENLQEDS